MKSTLAVSITLAGSMFCGIAVADDCGIPLSVVLTPVPADTPDNVKAFHGKWGEAKWGGQLCNVLYVREVQPDGTAAVTYVSGVHAPWNIHQPGYFEAMGKIAGKTLTFTNPRGTPIEYRMRDDGQLGGTYNGRVYITIGKAQ